MWGGVGWRTHSSSDSLTTTAHWQKPYLAIVLMLPSIHAQLSASLHRCLHAHAVSTAARLGASALASFQGSGVSLTRRR